MCTSEFRWCCRWLMPVLIFAALGCGTGRYPVIGKVTYQDGSPLEEGMVAGEATIDGRLAGVQGSVQKDGSFQWGTEKAGDGAFPGKYRLVVLPRALSDFEMSKGIKPAVDDKFTKYETSGLTHEVPNGPTELKIKVSKPKGR